MADIPLNTIIDLIQSNRSKSIEDYTIGLHIKPRNKMDTGQYTYVLSAPYGQVYSEKFKPYLSPHEMLAYGVFEGKYITDCATEFPKEWYVDALKYETLSPSLPDIDCNYFKIKSRQSLSEWIDNGWLPVSPNDPDNRGWFQWYCRYYIGRRLPDVDQIQIKRWRAFNRHMGQVKKNCDLLECRPKQRQALLQWAYDAFYPLQKPRIILS
jgi:hypothetical protein